MNTQQLLMEDRFLFLIARKFSSALTLAEAEELEQLLAADPSTQLTMDLFEQMFLQERQRASSPEADEAYIRHWLKYQDEITQAAQERRPALVRRKSTLTVMGFVVVALLGLGTWWFVSSGRQSSTKELVVASTSLQTYVTQASEKRKMSLPDGSVVWLNAGSRLQYDPAGLYNGTRQVFLEGEAYFDIAHDASRPFRVRSGAMEIKVLGTAFNVKAYPEDSNIETSLIRGAVEVRLDGRPDDVYKLRPHEKLVVSRESQASVTLREENAGVAVSKPAGPLVSLKRVVVADSGRLVEEVAWMQDKLVFRSEGFASLARMLERKYGYHFVFEVAERMDLEFTGSFTTETIVQALEAMRLVHPFEYRVEKENIYIR